ncbi:MAG: hypothetical protein JRJ73_12085 [Deltaproteobacteria bacterium]|nr:hypothetical protein [Deltaproteobacteria bacterium]
MSKQAYDVKKYRNGGEGFIRWVEENVRFSIASPGSDVKVWLPVSEFPDSYKELWKHQQEHLIIPGLEVINGEFKYRLIIMMWPRGEGKSVLAKLITLWKFFCFPESSLILGANSLGQSRFHHFDEMIKTISNSPKLLMRIGANNLKQKQIELREKNGKVVSFIRPVSSFSGIYSGCSGYVFNEFHQASNFKFFTEIDSSMRGVKNGLGVIDTTVAPKHHILYRLYQTWLKGSDPYLFYSYRTISGKASELWNPAIDQKYLDSQKERLPFGEYERFFINSWSAGAERVFTDDMIEASNFIGIDKQVNVHPALMEIIESKNKLIRQEQKIIRRAADPELDEVKNPEIVSQLESQHAGRFEEMDRRLWAVSDVYELRDKMSGKPAMATADDLNKLSEVYDTEWAILAGMDRADPMKTRTAAKTIVVAVAKGLMGSRTNPFPVDEAEAPRYLYCLLHLANIEDHSVEAVQDTLIAIKTEFDGIDSFGTERWGAVDLVNWCDDSKISAHIYYPTYSRQRTMFTELFLAYKNGRFKTPPVWVRGNKEDDILKEEVGVFDHNPAATQGKFGSPEKREKYGRQDDCMFALGSAIYGGLSLGVETFRKRKGMKSFGFFYSDTGLTGRYH